MIRTSNTGQVFTVTDSRNNTYRRAGQYDETVDVTSLAIYYAENIAAGANTVTVSDSKGGILRFAILEYSGVAASNSLDGFRGAQGSSSTPSTGNLTTTANGDLIIGLISTANPTTFTAGSGFTIEERVPATGSKLLVEDRLQPTAGGIAATATLPGSDVWGAAVAAFRAAAGGPPPPADLTITKTHTGSFTRGQTGATYTVTATNTGAGATTGAVTVSDTIPTGLTATGLAGTGWACTLASVSCTRNDALSAGASYPAITVTVTVAGNAPATVTNTATVSGGGETNTSNNSASDPTTVVAAGLPDLNVTKTHAGSFTRGQTGTYTVTVTNGGTAPTSGTVTMTDTLPSGLTASTLSGGGWACTLASLTCTRGDVLAAGGSYPAVTLGVNVASNAPSSVTNVAAVTGGGETNTGNNTASDPTTTVAPGVPDLTLTKSHVGSFTRGQTGATYTLTAANSGNGPDDGNGHS